MDLAQLTESQQEALQQYISVTNQSVEDAVPLLQRSQWNSQIAIAKFYDGEGPDPVAEALDAQSLPRAEARHENLQESLLASAIGSSGISRRGQTDVAPRVVPHQPVTARPPWILGLFFAPLRWSWTAFSAIFRTLVYTLSFLPAPLRPQALTNRLSTGLRSSTGRRMLMPRDTAARFKREFEEEYGATDLPFYEGGIAQAHDLAKKELRFLLIVLLSPEHDDTESFVKDTLLSQEVIDFLKASADKIILWGGNVLDSEAYQVSSEYNCTKFPFTALVCLTPNEGSTRMGIIKRLVGPMPAADYLSEIRNVIEKYDGDLNTARAERSAQEFTRNLRTEQDSAYERSLAMDRERVRQRKEAAAAVELAEKEAQEAEKSAQQLQAKRHQWRLWRVASIRDEPPQGDKDIVRIALNMPEETGAGRIVRRFPQDASMEEIYAFVDCYEVLQNEQSKDGMDEPDEYRHEYPFRIASTLPRKVFEPASDGTLLDQIGKSGNLIVEPMSSDLGGESNDEEVSPTP